MEQFSRFEMLVGEESVKKLQKSNVILFGLGGVGGNVAESLARAGVGNITIVDNDEVSISNINRQIIANHENIGKAKVDVMEKHLLSINPKIKVNKIKVFYLPDVELGIDFGEYDYIIDAIDTVTAKIELIKQAKEHNVPIICALGCGNRLDPTKLEVTDIFKTSYDPLAKVLRKKLRELEIKHLKVVYSKESAIVPNSTYLLKGECLKSNVPGSSPFVPPVAGIIIASEVVKDLLEK